MQILDLKCPGCGAPANSQKANCDFCGRPIVITSFRDLTDVLGSSLSKYSMAYEDLAEAHPESVDVKLALAICKIKLNQFDSANRLLTELLDRIATNPDPYFYLAVGLLAGKNAFSAPLANIKQIVSLLDSANSLRPSGIYALFQAYIAFDFYERKFLNISPNFEELLKNAEHLGVSKTDGQLLKNALNIESFGFPNGIFD